MKEYLQTRDTKNVIFFSFIKIKYIKILKDTDA